MPVLDDFSYYLSPSDYVGWIFGERGDNRLKGESSVLISFFLESEIYGIEDLLATIAS